MSNKALTDVENATSAQTIADRITHYVAAWHDDRIDGQQRSDAVQAQWDFAAAIDLVDDVAWHIRNAYGGEIPAECRGDVRHPCPPRNAGLARWTSS